MATPKHQPHQEMTIMRQRTVFKLCPTHKHYGGGRRTAEMFCEGGPYHSKPCEGNHCQIRPGADFFNSDVTDEIAVQWVTAWKINQPNHTRSTTAPAYSNLA